MYDTLYYVRIFGIKLPVGQLFCDYFKAFSFNFNRVSYIVYDVPFPLAFWLGGKICA